MTREDIYASSVRYHLSPVLRLLDDPRFSEILINGPDKIFVELNGRLVSVKDLSFNSEEELKAACVSLAQFNGTFFDPDHPRMDGRLPDGSRVHVIGPPCSRFLAIAIRKFSPVQLKPSDLVRKGTLSTGAAHFLRAAILLKKNIIVSGGTGSGKTTLLSVLAGFVPKTERIVILEDTGELRTEHPHVVQLEARKPDSHGRGQITMRDLLHSTLRLRPDRIIVGEVRGGEALDLLNALNSGHGGTMCTLHANSPTGALSKLETLVLFAEEELPIRAIRGQVAMAVDLVVQISRFPDGSRKIEHITEVDHGLDESGYYRVRNLFTYRGSKRADGVLEGELMPCGVVPGFFDEAAAKGVEIDKSWLVPGK